MSQESPRVYTDRVALMFAAKRSRPPVDRLNLPPYICLTEEEVISSWDVTAKVQEKDSELEAEGLEPRNTVVVFSTEQLQTEHSLLEDLHALVKRHPTKSFVFCVGVSYSDPCPFVLGLPEKRSS